MHSIYVSDPVHPSALHELSTMGIVKLGYGSHAVPFALVKEDTDAVLLRAETFDAEKITGSKKLKIIARHGVGTDNVDVAAAERNGTWVTRTPGSNSRAVAEHVFALLLSLARRTPASTEGVRAGKWSTLKPELGGIELAGRTLGLIGFGNIARIVAQIGHAFEMRILVTDPFITAGSVKAAGAEHVSLEQLLARSDVITLHVPLTDATINIIDSDALRSMRPDAFLINTSRGGLIDEAALLVALSEGHLAGVALDVLAGESTDMRDPLPHSALAQALPNLPNLLVTPHIAGQTDMAFLAAGRTAVDSIRQALAGGVPAHAVNDPRASSPTCSVHYLYK